jgi:hypothetical protein
MLLSFKILKSYYINPCHPETPDLPRERGGVIVV